MTSRNRLQRCVAGLPAVLLASFAIAAPTVGVTATTTRVSVNSSEGQADLASKGPSVSVDGRYVAFSSRATNLVAGDDNHTQDIFVRDRQAGTTERVSVKSGGAQAHGHSVDPSISGDGRFVAFTSAADDLVAGDTNGVRDIFVRDRQAGTTARVSKSTMGLEAHGDSLHASISADGRYVAFSSSAIDLVASDLNGTDDIFVRDREARTTQRVSVSSAELEAHGDSVRPAISATGRYVAFESDADDLIASDTNDSPDVFVRDLEAGVTTRVSVTSAEAESHPSLWDFNPSISAAGRFVAFGSNAYDLVTGDTNEVGDVFLRDRQAGTTTLLSMNTTGAPGFRMSRAPSISADGRSIAFVSFADDLIANDTNGDYADVFVRDRQAGTTKIISVSSTGQQVMNSSDGAAISADARFVGFRSVGIPMVPNDTNGTFDVFVRGPLH